MKDKVIFNGELINGDEAMVSFQNKDVQLGLNVFETMLANDGEIVGFELHEVRLHSGIERLGLGFAVAVGDLLKVVNLLLVANGLMQGRARVRITVIDGFYLIEAGESPQRPEEVVVILSDFIRNERSPIAGIKCGSYAENVMVLNEAQQAGVDEVILLNSQGDVAECATANVFMVKNGVLMTPELGSGCLPGITRELVLRRARLLGMDVLEEKISVEVLLDADEVFLTNTQIGVQAVSRIGELELEGCCGDITRVLRATYFA